MFLKESSQDGVEMVRAGLQVMAEQDRGPVQTLKGREKECTLGRGMRTDQGLAGALMYVNDGYSTRECHYASVEGVIDF